jgi:hypothetical protein
MSFIFAETQGMHSAAISQTGLAEETTGAGTQSEAAGLPVVGPGQDPISQAAAIDIKAYTSQIASQLAAGATLQGAYSESIAGSANGYILIDQLNAGGLSPYGISI